MEKPIKLNDLLGDDRSGLGGVAATVEGIECVEGSITDPEILKIALDACDFLSTS